MVGAIYLGQKYDIAKIPTGDAGVPAKYQIGRVLQVIFALFSFCILFKPTIVAIYSVSF